MQKNSFQSSTTAAISARDAIQKISEIPGWWNVSFIGHAEKKNDTFVVKMGGDSYFNFTVTEMIPDEKVVWNITDCHMPWYADTKEWANTSLVFDVTEQNNMTTVKFTHDGLTPDVACYKDCKLGWTHWITRSLHAYFTTGKGDFNKNFHTSIEVNAKPTEVLKRINQVSGWWAKKVKGSSAKINDRFTVDFGETYVDFQITELTEKKIIWTVLDCNLHWIDNKKEWIGTSCVFDVVEDRQTTRVNFTHVGLLPGLKSYEDCVTGWTEHINDSLVKFIKHGKGAPQ